MLADGKSRGYERDNHTGFHACSMDGRACLAAFGPVLDNAAQLQEAFIQLHIVGQQLGIDNSQNVVHCDVHLNAIHPTSGLVTDGEGYKPGLSKK